MIIVLYIVAWLVSLLALYIVIRLAVTHAITPKRAPHAGTGGEDSPPPVAWWQKNA